MLIVIRIVPIFNTLRRLYFLTLRFIASRLRRAKKKKAERGRGGDPLRHLSSTLCKGPDSIYTRRAGEEKC